MGLFDFFKKKEPAPAVTVTATIQKQTVEVRQRTCGELPLADIGGYVSPSGGFVNYGRFCVSGTNSRSGLVAVCTRLRRQVFPLRRCEGSARVYLSLIHI